MKSVAAPERREVSAGGVVYRRRDSIIEIALIRTRRRWGLPKGHLEAGERLQEAACREVMEETGLEGEVIRKLGDISYRYAYKKASGDVVRVFKRVHFYLLRWSKGEPHGEDYEVDEARWFLIDEALANLTYPSEKRIVRRALSAIQQERTGRGSRGRLRKST